METFAINRELIKASAINKVKLMIKEVQDSLMDLEYKIPNAGPSGADLVWDENSLNQDLATVYMFYHSRFSQEVPLVKKYMIDRNINNIRDLYAKWINLQISLKKGKSESSHNTHRSKFVLSKSSTYEDFVAADIYGRSNNAYKANFKTLVWSKLKNKPGLVNEKKVFMLFMFSDNFHYDHTVHYDHSVYYDPVNAVIKGKHRKNYNKSISKLKSKSRSITSKVGGGIRKRGFTIKRGLMLKSKSKK